MNNKNLLMTEGTIWKILIRFAFPLFLGGLFQQLYNTVDTWVVGKYCGDNALAAVGSAGSLCFLLVGFAQGVFAGASVLISNRYGAQDKEGVDKAIHTTVVFAVGLGLVLSTVGVLFTPTILKWMGTPADVMSNSVLYFRVYCLGLLALVLYNTSNGIFQALGDSRHPLYYLIISSLANVILDFWFVAGLDLGVAGAAMATVLGQLLSAILGLGHLMSGRFVVQIRLKDLKPDWQVLKQVLHLGIPSGVQNSVIAIANVVVQTNINAFGAAAMAGCASYSRVEGFVFLPITSLTMAMTTFVGQNLGAGRTSRVRQGARVGVLMTTSFSELVGVIFFLFAPQLISLFSSTPEVIVYGVRQAHVEALFFCMLGFAHACASILRGSGQTVTPMIIMLSIWCVFRILYITTMVHFIPNITVVFTAYPITWGISGILFIWALRNGRWSQIIAGPDQDPKTV